MNKLDKEAVYAQQLGCCCADFEQGNTPRSLNSYGHALKLTPGQRLMTPAFSDSLIMASGGGNTP